MKLISFLCLLFCLVSCTQQPKYEYSIDVTSESINDTTIERLKQRLNTISSQVDIVKKSNQQLSINFKSSASDTIVRDFITTKGNLSFYETKNLEKAIFVIEELLEVYTSDTTKTQNDFYDLFQVVPNLKFAELGYVKVEDTTTFNRLLNRQEIRSYLNSYPLRVKFAWGTLDDQIKRLPLYALEIGTRKRPAMEGMIVSRARASRSQVGSPSISIVMEDLQSEKWERLTRKASKEQFAIAIVLDDEVLIAPNVHQTIEGGRAEITGNLTEREAFTLSVILNSGPIEQLKIVDMNTQNL